MFQKNLQLHSPYSRKQSGPARTTWTRTRRQSLTGTPVQQGNTNYLKALIMLLFSFSAFWKRNDNYQIFLAIQQKWHTHHSQENANTEWYWFSCGGWYGIGDMEGTQIISASATVILLIRIHKSEFCIQIWISSRMEPGSESKEIILCKKLYF